MNISLDDALKAIQQHIDAKKNSHTDSLVIVACADCFFPVVFPFNRVKSSDTFEPYSLGTLLNSYFVINPRWIDTKKYERCLFPTETKEEEKRVHYDVAIINGITYNLVPQE